MHKSLNLEKYPVLSKDENRELIRKFQQDGDQDALNTLICSNYKFLISAINRKLKFANRNKSYIKDDLIQEGFFALAKAAKNFNLEMENTSFLNYARFWIMAVMQTYFEKNNNIVKNSKFDIFFDGKSFISDGESVSMSLDKMIQKTVAQEDFDCFNSEHDARTQFIMQENEERLKDILGKIEKRLSDKERAILSMRLMSTDPLTLAEIADKFDISRERIRQIEHRLLGKLKKELADTDLQEWSDAVRI